MEDNDFSIKELGGQERAVVLTGWGLPHKPFTLKTVHRGEVTWNAGSPVGEGTQVGSSLEPTPISGYWHSRWIGDTNGAPQVTLNDAGVFTAADAATLFDSICTEGQEVEVAWHHITRRGYLREFEQSFHTVHDIEWTAKFEWTSVGEVQPAADLGQNEATVERASDAMRVETDKVKEALKDPPVQLADASKLATDGAVAYLSAEVASLTDMTAALYGRGLSPAEAAERAIASLLAMSAYALGAAVVLETTPVASGAVPFAVYLSLMAYTRRVTFALRALRYEATRRRATLERRRRSGDFTVHMGGEGEDLRDVSRRYYQTPHQWRALLRYNSLTTDRLFAGQLVVIPNAAALAASEG
jgi:hypothetical protein